NVASDQDLSVKAAPELRSHDKPYAEEIRRLQSVISSIQSPEERRKQAFEEVISRFQDVAVAVAEKIVMDDSTELAMRAVQVLSAALGQVGQRTEASPSRLVANDQKQLTMARQALGRALTDPRGEVRAAAREALIAVSDEAAITSVKE